jgi:hypothetical protein
MERTSFEPLHDEIKPDFGVLAKVDDLHDIFVLEACQHHGFSAKTLYKLVVVGKASMENFDRK